MAVPQVLEVVAKAPLQSNHENKSIIFISGILLKFCSGPKAIEKTFRATQHPKYSLYFCGRIADV